MQDFTSIFCSLIVLNYLGLPLRLGVAIYHKKLKSSTCKKTPTICLFLTSQRCMFLKGFLFTKSLILQINFFCSLMIPQTQTFWVIWKSSNIGRMIWQSYDILLIESNNTVFTKIEVVLSFQSVLSK